MAKEGNKKSKKQIGEIRNLRANPYLRGVKRSRDGGGPANQRLASSSEVVSSSEVDQSREFVRGKRDCFTTRRLRASKEGLRLDSIVTLFG